MKITLILVCLLMLACSENNVANESIESDDRSIEVEFFEFLDNRDNKNYSAVKIGTQVLMAENLQYSPEKSNENSVKCPSNQAKKCEQLGYLYDWYTAMQIGDPELNKYGSIKGICPEGWHIPNREEWSSLEKYLTERFNTKEEMWLALRSESGWDLGLKGGLGTVGFNAVATGMWSYTPYDVNKSWWEQLPEYSYHKLRKRAFWWSSTVLDTKESYVRAIYETPSFLELSYGKRYLLGLRCFMDDSKVVDKGSIIDTENLGELKCSITDTCIIRLSIADTTIKGGFYIDFESDGIIDSTNTSGVFEIKDNGLLESYVGWQFVSAEGVSSEYKSIKVVFNHPPEIDVNKVMVNWEGAITETVGKLDFHIVIDDPDG